jgi:nucleotide-binding universal stress UspA family protein
MTFQHIVVPYEGGALSEDALRIACHLLFDESRITAVYVVPIPKDMPVGAEKPQEDTARETLKRAKAIGRELGVDVETYVAKAPEVAEGVNETAATLMADAVVMSLRHRHAPEETMLLSHTASRILRHAPCHVVITYRRDED